MDGSLGRRARNLLMGAVGGRRDLRPTDTPRDRADILAQAVGQAAGVTSVNGHAETPGPGSGVDRAGPGLDAAQALRRELEASLAMIFTSAADAIVTVDASHRIMMFNRAAEQLFGCLASAA